MTMRIRMEICYIIKKGCLVDGLNTKVNILKTHITTKKRRNILSQLEPPDFIESDMISSQQNSYRKEEIN